MVMSGGSRGIGLATVLAFARRGGNVALLAKTDQPHPALQGTIHTAVDEIRAAGGGAVGVVGDVRSEEDVARLVETAVGEFGGIDVVVNNASAIHTGGTRDTPAKKFGLMHDVNVRGTWLLTTAALPHLRVSRGTVLTLSPPLNLAPRWLGAHPAYTTSKYAMTLLTLGWAAEFEADGVSSACLWPETLIDTAAVRNVVGGEEGARSPEIMADAAMALLDLPHEQRTGRAFIDAEVLRGAGVADLSRYGAHSLTKDLFVD
ncbi:short-chain dehydrogenase [Knoellia sinensis KCTC 19936]|uniref:Short-chain dehydrogenase n=2 Tax=Knoellia TaxID=136099 RepID=A0A0A0J4X4_9MICO|nr:short-chain dehydrogenase [Knoellia sinensis KCTC 19936]